MTSGQRRAMQQLWPTYGIENIDGLLDFATIFDNPTPVTLEIGFGNGDNLIDMAAAAPGQNFLGIEVHEPGVGHCLLRIEDLKLKNVRLIRDDAVHILNEHIADERLQRVNLFFPDPWHKKRHHKRRIVQRDFAELIAHKLEAGGVFHVVTDWPDYADHIAEVMSTTPRFEQLAAAPSDRPVSRFDSRGVTLGHENWEKAWCTCSKLPISS
ncbi:MAG: tRNA (guanosine(46)-N7)-methyltransferase TrmB [Gammaproteobacteria bacterium]|jgi:tRNA (guanine-N7-)-methyltransferase|nr:tRNA (guanosine(46)-N7)-methyltransferase TrmB [Gammaproteobacteria bacterium]HJP05170.1 tRNA (guanosine(46)-N7)-methyltransferase TrmB [Gammaproteobacteria bacterium]